MTKKTEGFVRIAAIMILGLWFEYYGPATSNAAETPADIFRLGVSVNDTIHTGDTIEFFGRLFNAYDRKNLFSSDSIRSSIDDLAYRTSDTILIPQGNMTKFTSRFGGRRVGVTGTLIEQDKTVFTDTARIYGMPTSVPYRLVIEPKGPIDFNQSHHLDTLRIPANEQTASVYAIYRDPFDNFISYANISQWVSLDTTIVTVCKGDSHFGEGILSRNPTASGTTSKVYAVDANGARDTFVVILINPETLRYLRIMTGSIKASDTLVMDLNQDTTVSVQAWRSTDSIWIDVSATWQTSANLKIDPPGFIGNSWRFSPSDTGTGWVRVTLNNDGITRPDTLRVRFFSRSPEWFSIEIITPPDSIIAGKPVSAVIRTSRTNSFSLDTAIGNGAAYHDEFPRGGATFPEPFVMVDGKTMYLDQSPWGRSNQTFVNGLDTVSFTLFNAPSNTWETHQISGSLIIGRDTIHAASMPFVLHPDKLAQIEIVYPDSTPVTDTLHLTDPISIIARGYDKYSNRIGGIIGNWSVTGSLHPIAGPVDGLSISYDPRIVINDESGYIVVDCDGVRDSIYVIIKGPKSTVKDAAFIHPDHFVISASNGAARIHIPLSGTHLITAYSLSGAIVGLLRTNENDAQIRLPRGVYIVIVRTLGSTERFTTRFFNQ